LSHNTQKKEARTSDHLLRNIRYCLREFFISSREKSIGIRQISHRK